jgi:FSR family fosmidomycin resistance protein-like MFS transporter
MLLESMVMESVQTNRRELAVLALSHMFNDVSQGAIPALIPFLVVQRGLSYVSASGVVLAATVISSFIQPCLGYYSDRHPLPWLMPVGVLVGGLGIALTGVAQSYWMIISCVLLSGMGVAAFHPEGSRFANYVSGQRASGMSFFTVGGTIGFALGPVIMTPLVIAFGLPGTLMMALPALVVALFLARELPRLIALRPAMGQAVSSDSENKAQWHAFGRLTVVIVLRTAIYFGLMTFVPLYYVGVRSVSIAEANTALTVMLLSGAIGSLLGGHLAARIGLKTVLVGSLYAIAPLILGFAYAPGGLGLVCLALIGITTIGSSAVLVLMGQAYLCMHLGVASGITLGLAIGLGGLAVPIFGVVADHYGLSAVLYSMVALPVIAVIVAHTLPGIARPQVGG